METNRLRKTLAILLPVLFIVTVTASAVSAGQRWGPENKNLVHNYLQTAMSASATHPESNKNTMMITMPASHGPTPFPTITA